MSASFEPDEINLEGYEKLVKAIKSKRPPYARLGVLGEKTVRKCTPSYLAGISMAKGIFTKARRALGLSHVPTNADIAAAHEYGSPAKGLASRSLLRMPVTDHLPAKLEEAGAFGEDAAKEVVRTGSLLAWIKKVGVKGEEVVREAFASEGWGKWKKLDKDYARRKAEGKTGGTANSILQNTTMLRDSITSDVVQP